MSNRGKTTKEILQKKLPSKRHVPLYNPKALEGLKIEFNKWKNTVINEFGDKNWCITPHTVGGFDIPRELIYTPLNNSNLDYMRDLGISGEEPFTRGIHASMYRGRKFTIRQITGLGGPKDTNKRIRFMLNHGAAGISIVFDLPTIQMYDSDDPKSRGQIGMSGVAIDSIEDMDLLFKNIPLDKITVSLTTHYPSNTAILFAMYLALAERRCIPWEKLRGSVQNDTSLEEVVRSSPEYIPPRDCFRIQCDNVEFIRKNIPKWNFITLNGYNLRDYGTSGVTEMAVAIANGIETIEEILKRGYNIDWVARRITFFWSCASDFFEEVARFRAARRLWYKIMKYRFNAKDSRSMWMRYHVQTSGISLTREEPLNNIIRAAYQALAGIFGGAQSLHVDSYDEAYSIPTEEAALLSLRTQQIIQEETGCTEVVDPLGGSFYIEALTNNIEKRIINELEEIEKIGGYIAAIENGWIHNKIVEYFSQEQAMIENGDIKIVGQNIYKSSMKSPPIKVFKYPKGVEERQKKRLIKLKEERDNDKATNAIRALVGACKKKKNVMLYTLECVKVFCSVGEIFKAFKQAYGLWKPTIL